MNVIVTSISSNTGQGYFLKGNFGSGKSHFLAFLDYFFSNKEDALIILDQSEKLVKYKELLDNEKVFTVSISLLDHKANSSIEDILFNSIEKRVQNA